MLVGVRDRALLSVMVYSFARVSAAVGIASSGLLPAKKDCGGSLRLHENCAASVHDVPANQKKYWPMPDQPRMLQSCR